MLASRQQWLETIPRWLVSNNVMSKCLTQRCHAIGSLIVFQSTRDESHVWHFKTFCERMRHCGITASHLLLFNILLPFCVVLSESHSDIMWHHSHTVFLKALSKSCQERLSVCWSHRPAVQGCNSHSCNRSRFMCGAQQPAVAWIKQSFPYLSGILATLSCNAGWYVEEVEDDRC